MIEQALLAHDAIHRRLRSNVDSLLGKDRHDLAGHEISKPWIINSGKNKLSLFLGETMHNMSGRPHALITAESLGSNHQAPSPQRACSQAE